MTTDQQTPIASLAMVTIDCADPSAQAEFWAAVLGLQVAHAEADYAMLTGAGPRIGFGRVEGWQPPDWPNPEGTKRFHFDLAVDDLDAARARCEQLGATLADPQGGEGWIVLLDPAGHPFCLTQAANWG